MPEDGEISEAVDFKKGCHVAACNGLLVGSDTVDGSDPGSYRSHGTMAPFLHMVLLPELFQPFELRVLYFVACGNSWLPSNITMAHDFPAWDEKLDNHERSTIATIIALHAASKGVGFEMLAQQFALSVRSMETRWYFGLQQMNAGVHMEACMSFLSTYIRDPCSRQYVWHTAEEMPYLTRRDRWISRWIHDEQLPFHTKLAALVICQAVFFSSTFCSLAWLERRGVLHRLAVLGRLISRDEGDHITFAVALFRRGKSYPCPHIVQRLVSEAVAAEKTIRCVQFKSIGLDVGNVCCYVEFVGDRVSEALGYEKIYHTANPFDFADLKPLHSSEHFFSRPTTPLVSFYPNIPPTERVRV